MRKPRPVNTAIDARRINRWVSEYGAYYQAVTKFSIESWLELFEEADKDLAARVLDAVDFFGDGRIASSFREALNSVSGWHANPAMRTGRWRFAAFSGSAGESGDAMVYRFRNANNLSHDEHDEMFIHRSEIVLQRLKDEDTLVLLDDVTATGTQVCNVWDSQFAELVAGVGNVILMVVVAGREARQNIKKNVKDLRLVSAHDYTRRHELFSDECKHFTHAEKERLLHYATIADARNPKGVGGCGYLLVFQHKCPNNSISILHMVNSRWTGLFPRNG